MHAPTSPISFSHPTAQFPFPTQQPHPTTVLKQDPLRRVKPTLPLSLGIATLATLLAGPPPLAHQTEIGGEIGVTHHIEPNDTPRAGEPTQAWFALTKRGGKVVPLADCDCQLSLYRQPRSPNGQDKPLAQPPLQAIAAEGYRNVPAAQIVFPAVGAYDLVLRGSPKDGADFAAFQVSFTVTVASGSSVSATPTAAATQANAATQSSTAQANPVNPAAPAAALPVTAAPATRGLAGWLGLAVVASPVLLWVGWGWWRRRSRSQ